MMFLLKFEHRIVNKDNIYVDIYTYLRIYILFIFRSVLKHRTDKLESMVYFFQFVFKF